MVETIELFSWNINGMVRKFWDFLGMLRLNNYPKIVFLQELHSSHDLSVLWNSHLSMYYCYFSHGTKASRGTGLLVHRSLEFQVLQEIIDTQGRYVVLKGFLYGVQVSFASVYAPSDLPENREEFFDELIGLNLGSLHYIMGDFNSVLDRIKDRPFGSNGGDNELLKFREDSNSIEAWRHLHLDNIEYSYARHPENGPFSRIDLFFVSTEAIGQVINADYLDGFGISDHKPLSVKIKIGENLIGNDFKKIKPSTINHVNFIEGFKILWEGVKGDFLTQLRNKIVSGTYVGSLDNILRELTGECDFTSPIILENLQIDGEWWDSFKLAIFKLGRKVQIKNRIENIAKYRGKLQEFIFSDGDKTALKDEVVTLLQNINKEDIFKAQIEQRKYFEKNTGAFFKIIKEDRKKSFLDSLHTDNDHILKNRFEIQQHLVRKYKTLFDEKDQPFVNFRNFKKYIPKIDADIEQEDGQITIEEVKKIIFQTSSDKCPGLDGIPIEFYKVNFKVIAPFMVELFNRICSFNGEFPKSWDVSVLKLIPKCQPFSFDNLRALQLLNFDLKSLAGVWANRMGKVANTVINKFQTGGVKGRSIQDNTVLIHLLLQNQKFLNRGGFLVATDGTKAFDKIDRQYLYAELEQYGFTEKTVNVVKKFYFNNEGKLIINGFLSNCFKIKNGIRQGCPLSALLYVLAVEPLSRAILIEEQFLGFKLPNNSEIKLVQHVDDLNLFAQNEESIRFAINLINKFGEISGSVLNTKKSCIVKVSESNNKYSIAGIPVLKNIVETRIIGVRERKVFVGEFAKVFGIFFAGNVKAYVNRNWKEVFKKCSNAVEKWQAKRLSLIGKVLVLNVKIIPKMFYMLQAMEPMQIWNNRFSSLFRNFIGTGSCAIPIITLEWGRNQGGLGLLSINHKARTLRLNKVKSYLERLNVSELSPVSSILGYYLDIPVTSRYRPTMIRTGQILYGGDKKLIDRVNVRKTYFQHFLEDIVWYSRLEQKYVDIDHWTRKEYYNKLVEISWEWVREKQRGFVKIDYLNLQFSDEKKLWSSVFSNSLDAKIQSFNYKIVHDAVPTMEVIGGRSVKFKNKFCGYCSNVLNVNIIESLQHILIDCIIAQATWFVINDKLRSAGLNAIETNKNTIFYKFGVGKPQNHLISEVNYALWCNRCSNVYEDQTNSHVAVLKKVMYSLKKNSKLDKNILSIKVYNKRWLGLNQAVEVLNV